MSDSEPDTISRNFKALYREKRFQEALDLLAMTPQHHSYFNRGIE